MKMQLKKLIAILLAITVVCMPTFAIAYFPDTSDMQLYEIASIDFSTNSADSITYLGGRIENECLLISGKDGESPAVNLDIKKEISGKNCYADICYLDNGNFLFAVSYRNSHSQGVQTEITEGSGTGEYITKRIYLPDLCTTDGSDITIKSEIDSPQRLSSEIPLYIREITILTDNKETINVEALSDKPGNIFYDGEAVSFDASFAGTTGNVKELLVSCNVYKRNSDMTEVLYDSSEFAITVNGVKSVHIPLLLTVDEFALYTLELIATADDAYGHTKVDFSKSLISKESNPSLGACVHLVRFGDAETELRLMKNAGFSTVRDDFTWWEYESEKGVKKLTTRHKMFFETCAKYDIEPLMIVYGNNRHYDATNSDLVSDVNMDEFKKFITSALSLPEFDMVKRIEVWNEPSATHTLGGENIYSDYVTKGEQYAKILTVAYDAIKEERPDIKVGALSLSGMDSKNATVFVDAVMNYLNKNVDYQPFDAISYHPYLFNAEPEFAADETERYNKLLEGYGFSADDIWHTEYGYSTGDLPFVREMNSNTEMEQTVLTLRKYAALKAHDNSATSWIYDFADDTVRENIENSSHGLLYSRHNSTPYSAKPAYLAISALNRLTADAESCSEQTAGNGKIYTFNCPGRQVYLMYNTCDEDESVTFDIAEKKVYYYDIFGNALDAADIKGDDGYILSEVPFYAVTGEPIINQAIDDGATDMPVINISGSIASGKADKNIAVIVLDNDETLSRESIMNNALYLDQQKTGISGVFDFNVRFHTDEDLKAYIISEDSNLPIELKLHSIEGVEAVNLTSGMIRLNDENISMVNAKNMSVILNRKHIKNATDYVVLAALYKNNHLVYVDSCADNKAQASDSTAVSYNFSYTGQNDYDTIKLFVWRSLSSIEPLFSARIYNK